MLSIRIDSAGPADLANVAVLRPRLERWLANLDADAVAQQAEESGEFPALPWKDKTGWALTLEAIPVKPNSHGERIDRSDVQGRGVRRRG
jgi:hypothetical protein